MGEDRMSIPQARVTKNLTKSFLGLVTFYAKFIPGLADHTTVLIGHLSKDNKTKFIITNQFRSAFDNIISALVNHASLIIPKVSDLFCIFTDTSTTGIGGTLCVYKNSVWQPCTFYSRQLLPRVRNYSILDLEALAVLATVHHFHYYLAGNYFKIFTDHKHLVHIFSGNPPSARLIRWKINS